MSATGDTVRVDFLDGERRSVEVPVTAVVKSYVGPAAYMDIDALARLAGTGPRVSGVNVSVRRQPAHRSLCRGQEAPKVASISLQNVTRQSFKETMQENISLTLIVFSPSPAIVAFGVVYNSARIQLSERARELATLRVLGYGRHEASSVLLIEIGVIVAAGAAASAGGLACSLRSPSSKGWPRTSIVYRWSSMPAPSPSLRWSSSRPRPSRRSLVTRRVNQLDLVRVLKTRE